MASKSLMDAIKAIPEDKTTRPINELERLRKQEPQLYAELMEVIDSFIACGVVYTRFPTIRQLHEYVTENGIVRISCVQFGKWINERRRSNVEKA